MPLINLRNKITALRNFSFEKELVNIIEVNKEKIADLQAIQLFTGKNSKGEEIYPSYVAFTIAEKKKKGQVTSRVTYKDTGELYESLFVIVQGRKFSIKSNSFKFDKMIKRSGVSVIGLNYESRVSFIEEFTRPQILEAYHKKVTNI